MLCMLAGLYLQVLTVSCGDRQGGISQNGKVE